MRLPRIAVGQLRMGWTCEENTATLCAAIQVAANAGAEIAVFSELAVTGFHRQIKAQAEAERVGASLRRIQALCAGRAIAAVVGAPSFDRDGRLFNSHVHIDEQGHIAAIVPKTGLTPSEASFFAPGDARPLSRLQGFRCSSVLCREVEDLDRLNEQLPAGRVDLLFWPSFIGRPPTDPRSGLETQYLPMARRLAQQAAAHVIQANWANSLNEPGSVRMGESAVIAPNGELVFRLPQDGFGMAIFSLSECHYAWHPQDGRESAQEI